MLARAAVGTGSMAQASSDALAAGDGAALESTRAQGPFGSPRAAGAGQTNECDRVRLGGSAENGQRMLDRDLVGSSQRSSAWLCGGVPDAAMPDKTAGMVRPRYFAACCNGCIRISLCSFNRRPKMLPRATV